MPAALLFTASCNKGPENPTASRNLVLISVDTLRADHLGSYGYQRNTSPNLDKLAAAGTRFDRFYASSPWTLPSHVSIFTGLTPRTHGVEAFKSSLNASAWPMARILKKRGYSTAAIVCAPYLGEEFGLHLGFDRYDTDLIADDKRMVRTMKVAERVTDKALAYLDQRKTGRFFLFLHYWDPHYDYNPPKRYVDLFDPDYDGSMDGMNIRYRDDLTPTMNPRDLEHLLALYDGEIRYTDDHIGRFLDGLASRGLADTTMVVVTSDHGEEFLEHGWKGHTNHCYEETARVPLIVRVPWIETKAPAVTRLAGHPVILPTVLDALEVDGEGITLQGRSLVPLLAGRSARPRTAVICRTRYGHTAPPLASVGAWNTLIARAGMKLHRYGRDGAKATELYNVTRDPGEKTNLADVEKATAIKLTRRLDKSLAKQKREGRSTRLERRGKLKRATRRVLKSLGYTQ